MPDTGNTTPTNPRKIYRQGLDDLFRPRIFEFGALVIAATQIDKLINELTDPDFPLESVRWDSRKWALQEQLLFSGTVSCGHNLLCRECSGLAKGGVCCTRQKISLLRGSKTG
jgi:hypothetical protein